MSALDEWYRNAIDALGLADAGLGSDTTEVLAVAREVAHQVMRPAAPISTYLMGVAVGRGAIPETAAATLKALAVAWVGPDATPAPDEQ